MRQSAVVWFERRMGTFQTAADAAVYCCANRASSGVEEEGGSAGRDAAPMGGDNAGGLRSGIGVAPMEMAEWWEKREWVEE